MKTLNIALEEAEYNLIIKMKGKLTWKEFLLQKGRKTQNEVRE